MTAQPAHPVRRRAVLTGAAGVLAAAGFRPTPAAATTARRGDGEDKPGRYEFTLNVLGTTDLHGCVFNHDYYLDREYDDPAGDDIGLAKISTLVEAFRHEHDERATLLLDAGDTIQGTPLAYYFAKIEPIGDDRVHPMAAAMNAIGYDAAALGNHEFNYGIPLLRTFADQLDFPMLGANAVDWDTGEPAFPPFAIKTVRPAGAPFPLRVGILGLTNPGIAIWDKGNVEGRMRFPGLVEQAAIWVPRLRRAGCHIVIVAAHSGAETSSSYGTALPYQENVSTLVAEQVPGIDAILVGHAHTEIVERFVTNQQTGKQVLLTEPLYWGKRLSVMALDVRWSLFEGWRLVDKRSQVLNSATVPEDPRIIGLLGADHDRVVGYVNSVIGQCKSAMSASTARYEDAAALDFINHVQAEAVHQALVGTPHETLPVLSIAAPFNRNAAIPAGEVSVRDVAGLYIFDNTLLAVRLTGAELLDYLEKSAEFFRRVADAGPHKPDDVTNAPTDSAPYGVQDYNYDVLAGFDAPLTYDIDIARPVGERISNLAYDGTPVAADQEFAVAVNNYRQSGGGSYPHITDAEVLDNQQREIRQLLIDWVSRTGTIDPEEFTSTDWQLVAAGEPVAVEQ